jgi:radical SAM protein with 4Fe4S-binding SPASM domain
MKIPPFAVAKKDARFSAGVMLRRPFQVLLQVTNRCNMECSFCDFWPHPAPRQEELSTAEFARVSSELAELGCFLVSIEGGEPLCRPDIVEIVRAFCAQHVGTLFTNGWYMTEDKARALFAAGLTHACVSIDYATAERHDRKRGKEGATERAWRAVEILRDVAPRGGKQVHVMTVVMKDNADELPALFEKSAQRGVGHQITLLSTHGFRRGGASPELSLQQAPTDALPEAGIGALLTSLWERFPHARYFRDYARGIDTFLDNPQALPDCHAGAQSFNIDHVGNVAPCIEKIDRSVGNVRKEPLSVLHARLKSSDAGRGCQDCWTACRGFAQALQDGGSLRGWQDMSNRMRSW